MKKLLAITLTLVMILGTVGITASAESNGIEKYFGCYPGLEHMPMYTAPGKYCTYSQDNTFAYRFNEDNTIHLLGYLGKELELVIPETIDGYTVSSINTWFGDADNLQFHSSDSIDYITYKTNYRNMTKVTFPNTVAKLGLEYCVLDEIVVPEGVTELGLCYCDIEKVTFTDNVTTLYIGGAEPIEMIVNKAGTSEPSQLSKDAIVYGLKNTYVENYAIECGCDFISVGIFGDVNQDGSFNGKDVLELRKSIVGLESKINGYNSDVNFDGKINGKDVLAIRKQLVGLTSYLGEDTEPDDTTPVETPSDIVVEMPDNL